MATPGGLAEAGYGAGIRDLTDLATAVAVALAESGGNERAHNPVPPDDSYGAWQINMYGSLGPARRAKYGLKSNEDLYDLKTNARVMFDISNGGKNWKPWSTYNGARYKLLYPIGHAAATAQMAKAGAGAVTDQVTAPFDAAKDALGIAVKTGAWMANRNNWFRVVKVVGGLALVAGGVFLATRPIVKSAAQTVVQTVVPVGKAGKALSAVKGK